MDAEPCASKLGIHSIVSGGLALKQYIVIYEALTGGLEALRGCTALEALRLNDNLLAGDFGPS